VPNGMSLDEAERLRTGNPAAYVERAMHAMAQHVRAMLALQSRGAVTFDYGNNIRAQAQKAGVTNAFDIRGFVPEYSRPLWREGRVKAPLVIGRDHLDTGSVASPNRETEGMRDGSDAIADWPVLNALLNASSGATWVSVHHGGGVGIGYSLHAGMVIVADGSPDADEKLERVLTCDPGRRVARHGHPCYPGPVATAERTGLRIPMHEAR